jgi:phosphoenolpyruvate-protein kinase (PTS system EI component)
MIGQVVASGHARGVKVTVCGEMAGDPHCARVLVGLGVDAISVATVRLGKVKLALRELTLDDCQQVARAAGGELKRARRVDTEPCGPSFAIKRQVADVLIRGNRSKGTTDSAKGRQP